MKKIVKGRVYSGAELKHLVGGNQSYIRTRNNQATALTVNRSLNPDLPKIIIIGDRPVVAIRAKRLAMEGVSLPVFEKKGTNQWEYLGQHGPYEYRDDAETIRQLEASAPKRIPNSIAGGLFEINGEPPTHAVADDDVLRAEMKGHPSPEKRKKIEVSAVNFCRRWLESNRYTVQSKESENVGYDLLATKNSKELHVEVKGTTRTYPSFYLTRNEFRVGKQDSQWRLFIVTDTLSNPSLQRYRFDQMLASFYLDPIAWEGVIKE